MSAQTRGSPWGLLYIASLDLEKAFGQLEASAVERSLLAHGAPKWAMAAVLRQLVGQQAWATVAGAVCEGPLAFTQPLFGEWEGSRHLGMAR